MSNLITGEFSNLDFGKGSNKTDSMFTGEFVFIECQEYSECRRHGKSNQELNTQCQEIYLGDKCLMPIEKHLPSYQPKKCSDCNIKFKIDANENNCPKCGKELEWIHIVVKTGKLNENFIKIKGDAEKKAYEWKDWTQKTGRAGISHEPNGAKRNF